MSTMTSFDSATHSAEKTTICSRELTVLSEFQPLGLRAEALQPSDHLVDNYEYFLFDPEVIETRKEMGNAANFGSLLSSHREHEIFVRGNRIIWSTSTRVFKRFTLSSPVIKVCWCRLGDMSNCALCILQIDSLTIYNISGETMSIPLRYKTTSMWPLPFGLLLQLAEDVHPPMATSFSSSCPYLGTHDILRQRSQLPYSPQHKFDRRFTEASILCSHPILKDPLEELQLTYNEERGRMDIMNDFCERTIWTSDQIPLMVSFHKVKLQHSVWVAQFLRSSNIDLSMSNSSTSTYTNILHKEKFSFCRVWQGKYEHQEAACKVFIATDGGASPIICLLLQEKKKLLSILLQHEEIDDKITFDIVPEASWYISAIAAVPVVVTRPRVKVGLVTCADILVLSPENSLLLYCGKQCLSKYVLPCMDELQNLEFPVTYSLINDSRILGLADAVGERVNLLLNNGKILRCGLCTSPSSLLVNDCITAMAEGLNSHLYESFLIILWGGTSSSLLSRPSSNSTSEWDFFCSALLRMCRSSDLHLDPNLHLDSNLLSPWELLVNSKFHRNHKKLNFLSRISDELSFDVGEMDICVSNTVPKDSESSPLFDLLHQALLSLHALYENLKLDSLRKWDLRLLSLLLFKMAKFLGEGSYENYYARDFPQLSENISICKTSSFLKSPPCLSRWLEDCLLHGCHSANIDDLPALLCKNGKTVVDLSRKIVAFYTLLCGGEWTGKKLSTGVYCNMATGSHFSRDELTVLAMAGEGFGLHQLDLLPCGVSLPLRHAIDHCRESPPTDWPASAYILLCREDLALSKGPKAQFSANFSAMSSPYMLPVNPVTTYPTFSDDAAAKGTTTMDEDSASGFILDGMEHIFNSNTLLLFGRDLRLNEVRRLLCSARPVMIKSSANPSATEQDIQQAQLWRFAQRTTALPFGRGAFTVATISTLLTEAFTVPKLVLAGQLPAQQNAIVNIDPSTRNVQEIKVWPEFHNAVAAGLRLAPLQGKVSRTWIMYNKPHEPNVSHAGLLLALGLHGYLRVLIITDIYGYFTQEHESTTIGLLLGLASSYRGTMQPAISKALYVHIPAKHLSTCPDLEIPTLVQSAALMSIGLLYEGSVHPPTMQILLVEIGRRSAGDNVLEREGYAISAGFSLGIVALGRGVDMLGSMDKLIDQLFHFIGGKEIHADRKFLSMQTTDEDNRGLGQIEDGTVVNIDVTAPGAIIALALMFLKTESEVILSKLCIPQAYFGLQYVRPDFLLLRVIACNLIMWRRVHPSNDWIQSQIPEVVRIGIQKLSDDTNEIDDIDSETFVQAYVNIVAGACISLGLRFAGTRDRNAQELLYDCALGFLNEIKPISPTVGSVFYKGLSHHVDHGTLETYLHLIVLSLCVVMSGSGHLKTLRLLRFLHSRNSTDGSCKYGRQMLVSLSIGFLFLGGGMETFSTNNMAVASLLIALYPRLPTGPNDNRCHLQAFRHLYVLATEARWIQMVDVDNGLPVYVPLEVTVKETENYSETYYNDITPCILPERAVLKKIRVGGSRYCPQVIELFPEDKLWWKSGDKSNPLNSGILFVKRKIGASSYVDDPLGSKSLLSRAIHKVFGLVHTQKCDPCNSASCGPDSCLVDHLVGTFSSDPSLITFAQLCSDSSWNTTADPEFQEFCLQVILECISKDRPSLLQVYLSLYTTIDSIAEQVLGGTLAFEDSLPIYNLKLAIAYNEAVLSGKLTTSRGAIVQPIFLESIRKRVEDLINHSHKLICDFSCYIRSGSWPHNETSGERNCVLLSWYLQWYSVPDPSIIMTVVEKLKHRVFSSSSLVPLLQLVFPRTHINAISEIVKFLASTQASQ